MFFRDKFTYKKQIINYRHENLFQDILSLGYKANIVNKKKLSECKYIQVWKRGNHSSQALNFPCQNNRIKQVCSCNQWSPISGGTNLLYVDSHRYTHWYYQHDNTTVHGIIDDLTLIIESSFFKEKSDFVSTCHKIVIS